MKKRSLFYLVSFLVVFSMVLTSCKPAATATVAPAAPTSEPATQAPEATKPPEATATTAPTEAATAAPAFQGMKVDAGSCDYGGEFKTIEAVDEKTVKFTLCFPDPAFPSKVAFDVFAIADKASLDAAGGDSLKMSDNANGTGPFKVVSWTRGDNVTFEANPNYWGTKPAYKTLIFKWSEQAAQRLLELQSGTVDGIDNVDPNDMATVKADANLQLINRPALNIFYIGFNNTIAPFDNEKFRQAIAYAIDRKRIVDNYYAPGSEVATVFVPPALKPGWSDKTPWYEFDQAKAKALLTEIGWDPKTEIKLSFRNVVRGYLPAPDKVAQEIQAQLAEVGVKVKLEQQESTTFLDNTAAGKEGFFMLGWGADYPDATNFYDYHFSSPTQKSFGTQYPDVVDPIQKAAKLADPAARQEQYDLANAAIKQHVVMIPVAHGASAVAFQANVKNAMTSPLGYQPFYIMENGKDQLVWVQGGEPAAIWCADETDGESLNACNQVYEPLLRFKDGTAEVEPALASSFSANTDATEYTFTLRDGVTFHNGATLDANDVVASYKSQWDATDPNHKGRTGTFDYFGAFFGKFLNAPK